MSELRVTEAFEQGVEEVVERSKRAQQTRIEQDDEALRAAIVHSVAARIPNSVVARVSAEPDQFFHAALEIAGQLGPAALTAVDERLRSQPSRVPSLLDELLADRPLIVDGRELIGDLGSGTDRDLRRAIREDLDELAALFDRRAKLIVSPRPPRERFAGGAAPITLGQLDDPSELWKAFGCQTETFQLWLSYQQIVGESPATESVPEYLPTSETLRGQIESALAGPQRRLLHVLCAHARPLPRTIVDAFSLGSAVDYGEQLRLWHADVSSVWMTRSWARWWRSYLPATQRLRFHKQLARHFHQEATRENPELSGPAWLETHRHYVLGQEDELAKQSARYGATVLVDFARTLSFEEKYQRAASLYEFVVENAEHNPPKLPVNDKLLAYAQHYLHYNRNRANAEGAPLGETIVGYERALELWPENAYFWSRLIRAYFYDGRPKQALQARMRALGAVPDHHQKYTIIVARTVDGLMDVGRPFEAALVWRDHQPLNHREGVVFGELVDKLTDGWSTDWLRIPDGPQLAFHYRVHLRIRYRARRQKWLAEIPELQTTKADSDPIGALTELVLNLREETRRLLEALTHELDEPERQRKQQLLGTVDVVTSQLQAEVPPYVWAVGELEQTNNGLYFRLGEDELHPLAPALGDTIFDRHPRFARFETDEVGRPRGPVLELEQPIRGEIGKLWDELRARRASG